MRSKSELSTGVVLTIGETSDQQASAIAHQYGFNGDVLEMNKESTPNPNNQLPPGRIVILGHSSQQVEQSIFSSSATPTVAGFTAKEMASYFRKRIKKNVQETITDIDLISCEAGWKDSQENPCFARQFAFEMYKRGFKNIRVHAITSPQGLPDDFTGMRVELTGNGGVAGLYKGKKTGHVNAYLCTAESDAIDGQIKTINEELESPKTPRQNKQLLRQKNKELQTRRQEIIHPYHLASANVGQLQTIMDSDENTFMRRSTGKKVAVIDFGNVPRPYTHEAFLRLPPAFNPAAPSSSSAPVENDPKHRVILYLASAIDTNNLNKSLVEKITKLNREISTNEDWQRPIWIARAECKLAKKKNKDKNFSDFLSDLVKDCELIETCAKMEQVQAFLADKSQKNKEVTKQIRPLFIAFATKEDWTAEILNAYNTEKINRKSPYAKLLKEVIEKYSLKCPKAVPAKPAPAVQVSSSSSRAKVNAPPNQPEPTITSPSTGLNANKPSGGYGAIPVSANKLPNQAPKATETTPLLTNRYPYKTNPRHHFFREARVAENQQGLSTTINRNARGDVLKAGILDDFNRTISNFQGTTVQAFDTFVSLLKESVQYEILNKSQGLFTFIFQWLVRTDSVKAFDDMVAEKRAGLTTS